MAADEILDPNEIFLLRCFSLRISIYLTCAADKEVEGPCGLACKQK